MAVRKEFDFVRVGNIDIYVPQYDDTDIKKSIANETTARTNADNVLQSAINKEKEDRQYKDSSLETAITNEVSNRKTADSALQKNIDDNGTLLSALRQEFNSTRTAKSVVIIGDSYAEGYTPDGNVTGWADKVASSMPYCTFKIKYSGGAGFSHVSASTGKKFIDLLNEAGSEMTEANRNNVSLVLIGGGMNDRDQTKADLKTAIDVFATRCRELYPYADITYAFIGWSSSSSVRNKLRTECSNLRSCRTSGMKIITSTAFTLHDYKYFSSDGIHPNNDGEDALAQTMAGVILGSEPNITIEYSLYNFSSSEMASTVDSTNNEIKNYLSLRSTFSDGNTNVMLDGRFRLAISNVPVTIATYPKNLKVGEGWTTPPLTDFACTLFGRDKENNYFTINGFVRFSEDWKIQVYHKEVDSSAANKFKTIDCNSANAYCNIQMPMSMCSAFDL
nr:MAG TPA: hydrolase-like protein [Bacteriophage sp.]